MDVRESGATFGELHFGAADLGDRRRTRRLVASADAMIGQPAGTLPDKFDDPAGLKGLYRLMDCPAVTHAAVLEPARQRTLGLMAAAAGTVLVIHDWTELDYTSLGSLADRLGQTGNGSGRGLLCANALAIVAETREVLGLAWQKLALRPTVGKGESRVARRSRADRETRLWREAGRHIPAASAGHRQIEVADRGADVLEYLDFMDAAGKSYLVRSKHNRRILLESGEKAKLHDFARGLPAGGGRVVEVGAAGQRPAREARVAIAWARVTLRAPLQPRGETRRVPLTTWVVCVREVEPPPGVEPLEWILLTNVRVETAADSSERLAWYEARWVIEEYHKALKTGCGVETLQFTAVERLEPAIALLSVVATHLLALRDAGRRADADTRPAAELFPAAWVRVLSLWRYREDRPGLSVREFMLALARLGGHQNRTHDHPPGWLVLWRGWTKLQAMTEAAALLEPG